jgi:hypothetical protein
MKKIKSFINSENVQAYGTSLVDKIEVTFAELTKVFGKRTFGASGDNKCAAQWHLLFEDGTVATIYDYKECIAYCGRKRGKKVGDITDWHIGGNSERAAILVKKELGLL